MLCASGCTGGMVSPGAADGGSCEVIVPDGGAGAATSSFLPGGQGLTPSGMQVPVGGFPFGFAIVPGTSRVVVGDSGYTEERLRVVDVARGVVVSEKVIASHFLGLAVSKDGGRVYASSPNDGAVLVYTLDAEGQLALVDTYPVNGYPAGLALSPDGHAIYVAVQLTDEVVVLDAGSGAQMARIPLGSEARPYQVLASPNRGEIYATMWGMGGVAVIDAAHAAVSTTILTGKNPGGEVLSKDGATLWVANSDDDTIAKIDVAARNVVATASLRDTPTPAVHGDSPSDIALSPDETRLYVTAAGANALFSIAASDLHSIGALPTAWYPTSLAALPSGAVVVANGKGLGIGPNLDATYLPKLMRGTLSIFQKPDDDAFAAGAPIVDANAALPHTREAQVRCTGDARFPISTSPDLKDKDARGPIEHVILLVRENKTYDAELGDLGTGNGDPKMVLFGEKITPNLHALARQFTNLDNYYSDAEVSVQGHEWTTAAMANDFTEKTWFTDNGYRADLRPDRDQARHIARPAYGSFFQDLEVNHVDFVVWGEIVGFDTAFAGRWDVNYPGLFFDLDIADVDKEAYVAGRIQNDGFLPPFGYLLMPRNHTYGTTPGKPTPITMVADNDLATGRFVEAVTHSSFWPHTAIFIIEDDPQDGGDHVEAHRSICLVISPYSRHGATVSSHFDVSSLYRTIELILRVPPMNRGDAQAAAMLEAFTDQPDLSTFTSLPSNYPDTQLNPNDAPLGEESKRLDFSGPDRAVGLGRILWRAMKGTDPPWHASPTPADPDDD